MDIAKNYIFHKMIILKYQIDKKMELICENYILVVI
jgi:hypothetical protein